MRDQCKCEKRGAKESLTIMAMQDGGFVVSETQRNDESFRPYLIACTTLGEALEYIRTEMRDHG